MNCILPIMTTNKSSPQIYRVSSSKSDELLIVLYWELRVFNILKKLPTAKMVRRWRWKMPWYNASRSAFRSSTTSICDDFDVWCVSVLLRSNVRPGKIWNVLAYYKLDSLHGFFSGLFWIESEMISNRR